MEPDREVTICPDPNESSPALPTPEVKAKDFKKLLEKKGVPSLAISTPIDMVTYDIYYIYVYILYICIYYIYMIYIYIIYMLYIYIILWMKLNGNQCGIYLILFGGNWIARCRGFFTNPIPHGEGSRQSKARSMARHELHVHCWIVADKNREWVLTNELGLKLEHTRTKETLMYPVILDFQHTRNSELNEIPPFLVEISLNHSKSLFFLLRHD